MVNKPHYIYYRISLCIRNRACSFSGVITPLRDGRASIYMYVYTCVYTISQQIAFQFVAPQCTLC